MAFVLHFGEEIQRIHRQELTIRTETLVRIVVHALGGQYNIAGIKLPFGIFPNLKDHRYDGYLYGGGLTLGHQWILNKRWSIEAAIGAGYARVHYDKYNCGECGSKIETKNSNYWGVTKAALSIIYFIH